jgi:hypothetical protein
MNTVTNPSDILADQLEAVRKALTPLLETLKGVVDGRDRLIAVRLGEWDLPVEVGDDGVARTTHEGNQHVVCPTFEEIEDTRAFLEVVRLHDLIDAFEAYGLAWGILGDDVPQSFTLEDMLSGTHRSQRQGCTYG